MTNLNSRVYKELPLYHAIPSFIDPESLKRRAFKNVVGEKGENVGDQKSLFNPLPDDKILDSSKLKEFADDNFKFDKNGRKLSKWGENTVGKGEIAHYEQFPLFPQCLQKVCFPGASKGVIVWEWVKQHYQG